MIGSVTDWLIFIVVILILFGGASKIPELARALGRAMGEFRKGQLEIERELKNSSGASTTTPSQATPAATAATVQPANSVTGSTADVNQRIAALEKELNDLKQQAKGAN